MANFEEAAGLIALEAVEEAEIRAQQENRQFYPRINAFNLSDEKFIKVFRLSKDETQELIISVTPFIVPPTRGSALDVATKVLIALRFFASGSYQTDIGLSIHTAVSQASVSRSIKEVVDALNQQHLFNQWVKFPENLHELNEVREQFYTMFRFPGVVGCVDCTHVAIFPPEHTVENLYVNRKNYHSINVQLICDSRMKIINVNALYSGSTNDAFIWNNSNICRLMETLHENGYNDFYLLGDSGYPLRPWLLTPLETEPLPETPESSYNNCHKSTRAIIENCNGLLKMRFRCLLKHRVLHYSPEIASHIVNACVVLHNMCIERNVPLPDRGEDDDEVDLNQIMNEELAEENDLIPMRRVNPHLHEARRMQRKLIKY